MRRRRGPGDGAMSLAQEILAMAKGAEMTAIVAIGSTLIGAVLAFAFGIARVEGGRLLSWLALIYIEFMRGTPLLVKLFWLYYALPLVGVSLDPFTTGIVGLSLNIGAYGAEVVRGGLQSVATAQREAARALNFPRRHTLLHILLPQAVVEMMPAFGNLAIQNLKDTALVSLISIADLTFRAQQIRNLTLAGARVYSMTLVGYFVMSLLVAALMRFLEIRARRGAAFAHSAHG